MASTLRSNPDESSEKPPRESDAREKNSNSSHSISLFVRACGAKCKHNHMVRGDRTHFIHLEGEASQIEAGGPGAGGAEQGFASPSLHKYTVFCLWRGVVWPK